jgi:O-antigen/teichoic acid export membrane protein
MQKQFNGLLKSIFIYGFGNISVKLVGLLLLPLYTDSKLLTVNEYGTMGVLDITAQVLLTIFSLSLYSAYARWYWDKAFTGSRKSIFFTCLVTLAALGIIVAITGIFASGPLSTLLFSTRDFARALMLMMIAVSMQPVIDFILTQMRVDEKPFLYVSTNIVRLLVILCATIYFLKYRNLGLVSIYIAQVAGNVAYLIITSGYIIKKTMPRFTLPVLKDIIRFSMPLALASLSNVLLVVFDRYVLNFKSTPLNVGIYTQGFKLANTLKVFIINSVQLALSPVIFKLMNRPDHKLIYAKIMTWFTILVVFFSLFFSLFSLEITKFFTTSKIYWDAYRLVPILCLGITFGMLKDVSATGLQVTKRTRVIGIMLAGISLFNLAANLTLVPLWGIYGAAVSSLVSQGLFFILLYLNAQKHYPIPYRLDKVVVIIISGVLFFLAGSLTNDYQLVTRIVLKTMALVFFTCSLILLRVVDNSEIRLITSFLGSVKNLIGISRKEEDVESIPGIEETTVL